MADARIETVEQHRFVLTLSEDEAKALLILMQHLRHYLHPGPVLKALYDVYDALDEHVSIDEDRKYGSVDKNGLDLRSTTFEGEDW